MISRYLLTKVYGFNVGYTEIDKETNTVGIWKHINEKPIIEINIYELAHKCKEWANKQENCFAIVSGKIPSNYFCCLQYRFQWLGTSDFEKYFRADTEPEAIFKACEWILENIK